LVDDHGGTAALGDEDVGFHAGIILDRINKINKIKKFMLNLVNLVNPV